MADAPEQQEGQQEQKPKSKLPFIIGGLVVLLIGIVAVSMTLLGGKESGPDLTKAPRKQGDNYTFPDPFVVNLAPPDDQYLCNANITLEILPKSSDFTEAEALEEMGISNPDSTKHKMPIIKMAITEILSSKTRIDVTSPAGRLKIRGLIKNTLNMQLEKAEIIEVYMQILVP